MPRILPLVGVAIGGVLAVNALSGARDLPGLVSGAQAFAAEAAKAVKPDKDAKAEAGAKSEAPPKADPTGAKDAATTGEATDAAAKAPSAPAAGGKAVCAPTAAEMAKQAGLSPAELQVLQSLGTRRGQLDQRESDLSTQIALMAAAEAKLDAKIKTLTGLKGQVQGLLTQSNAKEAAEIDRLVKVFEGMKAKDAAPRIVMLDDNVRIPIAAKMKERALSAILSQMPAPEAKKLTESLARRYSDAQNAARKAEQLANDTAPKPSIDPTAPVKTAEAKPAKKATPPRRKAPSAQQASAKPAAAKPAAASPTAPEAPATTG